MTAAGCLSGEEHRGYFRPLLCSRNRGIAGEKLPVRLFNIDFSTLKSRTGLLLLQSKRLLLRSAQSANFPMFS